MADGDVLDVPGKPRIVHVPGHTPGSVAVHVPAVDAVFLGDAMTTRNVLTGVEGPKPAPFTLDPDQARESLARLEGLDATWVLPGHGPAWDGGVPDAVRLIREG
jgi:glyoxylase-like metal-dependent hydrolase (beta-lactamase superfamily II)